MVGLDSISQQAVGGRNVTYVVSEPWQRQPCAGLESQGDGENYEILYTMVPSDFSDPQGRFQQYIT